jgi:hypothetical protein
MYSIGHNDSLASTTRMELFCRHLLHTDPIRIQVAAPAPSAPATTTFQSTLLMLVPITTFKPWGIDAIG